MKIRSLILGLMLITGLMSGCNDDINYVGGTIQPDKDRVDVAVDSFMMTASTIKLDSIYSKSSSGFLGQFYDPQFGEYKADFICQFYCQEDFKFRETPKDGKIDSVQLFIYYDSYIGDSLSPMRVDVYPVVKSLEKNYYTNINPLDYADTKTSLGGQAYTPYHLNSASKDSVKIDLNTELGQKIYDETINNPASFKNQNAFNEFFRGIYVTNTYGMGNALKVTGTILSLYYSYDATTTGSDGKDSAYVAKGAEFFIVTDEVIQMNRMNSYGLEELLQPNEEYTYLKTPAGVCTRLVMPGKEIHERIGNRTINNVPLSIQAMPQSDWEYASEAPGYLLLLPEDSLITFFEKNKTADLKTSFTAQYDNKLKTYKFSNIARLLQAHNENNPEEDLNLLLVPVTVTSSSTSTSSSSSSSISHWQKPSGVVLRKDPEVMKLKVTTSKFNE